MAIMIGGLLQQRIRVRLRLLSLPGCQCRGRQLRRQIEPQNRFSSGLKPFLVSSKGFSRRYLLAATIG